MKHLRFINILIVMLLLAAWAPAPQMLATVSNAPAALAAAPVLTGPASGALITGYRPDFTWKQPAYTLSGYQIEFSFDTYFKNSIKFIASADVTDEPVNGIITYTPDFDLPSNSLIYWRVRSVISDGVYSNWAKRSVKTKPLPLTAIVEPKGGENAHTLRPTLKWTPTPDPIDGVVRSNKFDLQVRIKNGAVVKSAVVTGGEYLYPADLKRNTEYQWRIRVKGAYFTDPAYSGWEDFVSANPPSVPVLTAPASGYVIPATATSVLFTWNPSTSTKTSAPDISYVAQVALDSKFSNVMLTIPDILEPQLEYTDPIPPGTYYWRVMAVDSEGDMSNWSAARVFKTQPALVVHIVDYLTTNPIEGAQVAITGIPDKITTGADGTIPIFPIKAGTITVTSNKDDYMTKKLSTTAVNGVVREVTLAMVRIPMKAVLSWKTADNLDLHLWIPADAARDPDKIDGHIMADHRGVTTKHPWARLSGDIAKGNSTPETITIQNRYPGDYYLAVFDYRTNLIKDSQATVKIYRGSTLAETLTVPTTGDGRWWLVAIIDGATGTIDVTKSNNSTASPGPYDPDGGTYALPEE